MPINTTIDIRLDWAFWLLVAGIVLVMLLVKYGDRIVGTPGLGATVYQAQSNYRRVASRN